MPTADVLVIGSGIAGLSVAIKTALQFPDRQCVVITKQESAESNTRYAQGGIAVVTDFARDSFEAHIQDTLAAGDGLCDRAVVEHVIHQAPERLRELIDLGAEFDRDPSGQLLLGREGGHKANRIIHHHDLTGLNISTALLEKVKSLPNVALLSHHVAIDLITLQEITPAGTEITSCKGAEVLNLKTGKMENYLSLVTILATGGTGQLYQTTTNPLIATGDGIAMAYRAGARVSNMEFVQFHPTAFFDPEITPAFLISEAVRGQGAYLRNAAGERFMFRYHIDGELACRDIVSRAIASEIMESNEPFVFLDCTGIAPDILQKHFPNIYQTCLSRGIDLSKDYVPVAPAAHYMCGGIDVDLRSRTTLQNLYACGECSNTGLHGANRLASNSLLEATVFAHNCFLDIEETLRADAVPLPVVVPDVTFPRRYEPSIESAILSEKLRLQQLMSRYAGIVRTSEGLHHAWAELQLMEGHLLLNERLLTTVSGLELRNMLICAKLIVKNSLDRKENRGGFYNRDLALDEVAG